MITYQRWGGVTEHAATGLLRDAAIYSAVSSGARYAFAEPQTMGEAFIPKRGDPVRSMGILNHAASWYGAQVVPGGAGGGGSATVTGSGRTYHIHVNVAPGANPADAGAAVVEAIKAYERLNGSSWRN